MQERSQSHQSHSDRETLIRIYKALISSKIDYGCFIYGAARPSMLKVLDSIQGTALRLALGAFRTSPYESLCVEAGVPPLKFRREQLLVSYCCGILTQPHHPCYPPIPSYEEYDIYERRATIQDQLEPALENC
ncbi:hypothetical protein JTB14_021448 [Gonioctena quinquepunctata]|nr:hypothetical protein JTB14_021448 [Gonioctena quinquepunctata]